MGSPRSTPIRSAAAASSCRTSRARPSTRSPAAAAIRDHARSELGLDRLISLIDPGNVASQAVARRIGMHHERDLVFEERQTSLFALENRCQAPVFQAGA
jgi:hypothetical protein